MVFFFFSSRRRHTRWNCDWSSDVCSSDLDVIAALKPSPNPGQGDATTRFHQDRKSVVLGKSVDLGGRRIIKKKKKRKKKKQPAIEKENKNNKRVKRPERTP